MIGDICHVFNRGVEKRKIFLDNQDYKRFVDNLFLLNNKSGKIRTRHKDIFANSNIKREKLVEILMRKISTNSLVKILTKIHQKLSPNLLVRAYQSQLHRRN